MVAVVALPALPALVAYVALATVPVTLAPGILVNPAPDPLNWLPVMLPVADINPPVNKLPLVVFPVTFKLLNVPTEVMVFCAAVCSVPVINAPALPIVAALTVAAVTVPPVVILPAVTVPDALNAPLTLAPLLITQVLLVLL